MLFVVNMFFVGLLAVNKMMVRRSRKAHGGEPEYRARQTYSHGDESGHGES